MPEPQDLRKRALSGVARLVASLGLLLFLPAGSVHFWQAWIFLLVFSVAVLLITFYLLSRDPDLVERRLRAGPGAERERSQKIILALASVLFTAGIMVPGFDHRGHWSQVPAAVALAGDLCVALGFLIVFLAFRENSFASATIEVSPGQRVSSTGPYRIVRHPVYAGAILIEAATPFALGSWRALVIVPFLCLAIICRLLGEEKFLAIHLPGYAEYQRSTRYRLVPWVW